MEGSSESDWMASWKPRRPRVAGAARDAGMLTTTMTCPRHGTTEFVIEGRGYYRCKRCRADGVVRHRQKVKAILVEEAGGRCVICGYARHLQALQFHHVDPGDKRPGAQWARCDVLARRAARGGEEMRPSLRKLPRRSGDRRCHASRYSSDVARRCLSVAWASSIHQIWGSSMAERTAVNR